MLRSLLITAISLVSLQTPSAAHACTGDCDGGGSVTVDEIVRGVTIALGDAAVELCTAADANVDGAITVEEIVRAIGHALGGCPPAPTPSPSPTASPTASVRPTATVGTPEVPRFVEVAASVGLDYEHDYVDSLRISTEVPIFMGGVAAGDYDGDGWVDLYAVGGDRPNLLLRNVGGRFTAVDAPGLVPTGGRSSGPTFADVDGDGLLDLFVGAVEGGTPRLFRNLGNGSFTERTADSGIVDLEAFETMGAAFGDYDGDGDLDLFTSHWGTMLTEDTHIPYMWRNDGDFRFADVTAQIGIPDVLPPGFFDHTFTPNFVDIDSDGRMDILLAIDFGGSAIVRNRGGGSYSLDQAAVLTDENGMGAAIGDYDNDGDLDWFVSSIYDPDGVAEGNWGVTGNRLYRNDGNGNFRDVTTQAGVRQGFWGWAACFADVDNDGWLDLFHVNGMGRLDLGERELLLRGTEAFQNDPARLFLSRGDGTFREVSAEAGVDDRGQGRGVVCFDYDRDGDIDLFIANNGGPPALYRNDLAGDRHWLAVELRGAAPNSQGIGARVIAITGDLEQMRELRAGSNYVSQDPAIAHFGLGDATRVDTLAVQWPHRAEPTVLRDVAVDRYLVVHEPGSRP